MQISQSFIWRSLVTLVVAVVYVFLYETTIRDSRYAARQATIAEATSLPQAGAQLAFTATAYCKGETTASGVIVRVDMPNSRYSGIWTIMDTGPAVQGRLIDLYLWSCTEALAFGRRPVRLTVLRLGWNPQMSAPGLVDRVFRQREADAPPPSVPATDGSLNK